MIKNDKKMEIIKLRGEGFSIKDIANKLDIAFNTVLKFNSEYSEEIANLKAIELEGLYQQYYLQVENKIKLLGEELIKINTELEKRNYDDVQTDKLLDLKLKYLSKLE